MLKSSNNVCLGSIITFKDNNGNVLPPSPVDFTGQSLYLTFDDYNPLPGIFFLSSFLFISFSFQLFLTFNAVGENLVFVGKIFDTISSNFTATLTSAGHLYGTGEDEVCHFFLSFFLSHFHFLLPF